MKKLVLLITLCIFLVPMSNCFAARYLNGDRNMVNLKQDTYINKVSVNVKKYAPPEYIVSIEVIEADMEGNINSRRTETFYYDYNKKEMYCYENGQWIYVYPDYREAVNADRRDVGEAAFYVAYKIPFYGCFDSYDRF